jgi:hypothetical protein
MTKEQIKQEIENIDNQLCEIDEALLACDESSEHEMYKLESELMFKKYTLIQQYEQLIAY